MVYTRNLRSKSSRLDICPLIKTTVPPIRCSMCLFRGVRRKPRLPLQRLTRGSRADSVTWGNWYWRNKAKQRRNRKRKTGMTCSLRFVKVTNQNFKQKRVTCCKHEESHVNQMFIVLVSHLTDRSWSNGTYCRWKLEKSIFAVYGEISPPSSVV